MSLKGQIEAVIYAAEEPITLDQLVGLLKDHVPQPVAEGEPAPAPVEPKALVRAALDELVADYAAQDRGMEIREVAGGYRMSTKPEHHDLVRAYAKALKPPIRLSLPALETLSVIAYKQPITAPEISEIRGVDCSGVLATLLDRKLITTAGRKAVVGRPILYRTTKEFLLRFGLKDVTELPSLEEFEKLASSTTQEELFAPVADATGIPDLPEAPAAAELAHGESAPVTEPQTNAAAEDQPLSEPTTSARE